MTRSKCAQLPASQDSQPASTLYRSSHGPSVLSAPTADGRRPYACLTAAHTAAHAASTPITMGPAQATDLRTSSGFHEPKAPPPGCNETTPKSQRASALEPPPRHDTSVSSADGVDQDPSEDVPANEQLFNCPANPTDSRLCPPRPVTRSLRTIPIIRSAAHLVGRPQSIYDALSNPPADRPATPRVPPAWLPIQACRSEIRAPRSDRHQYSRRR